MAVNAPRQVSPLPTAALAALAGAGDFELTPRDLLLLGILIANRSKLASYEAAHALQQWGYKPPDGLGKFAERLVAAASGSIGLTSSGPYLRISNADIFAEALKELLARFEKPSPASRAPASDRAGRVRRPAARVDVAPQRRVEVVSPPRASTAPPPPTSPAASIPAPPPFEPAPVISDPLIAASLAALLTGPRATPRAASLTLRAHAIAHLERFEDLLSPGAMRETVAHEYQLETVRRVLRALRGRALLADEVGLGKTVEALMVLTEYRLRGMARRVLVLAPPALVGHWVGELSNKAGIAARSTDEGTMLRDDPARFWSAEGVVVASLATARLARHAEYVRKTSWDLVVVDEAHHLKRQQTLAFKLVDSIRSRFLLLLTATPIETNLEELYVLVTLLKPGQFSTLAAFRERFVDDEEPCSPKNRERLRALLSEVMVRNTRAQSGLALPPRYVTTVLVEPSAAERDFYERVVAFYREFGREPSCRMLASTLLLEAGSSALAAARTLAKVSGGPSEPAARALAELASSVESIDVSPKIDRLLEIIRAQEGEQVLVFSRYRATVEAIVAALERSAVEHVVFQGGLSAEERARALDRFRGGCRVMVATDVGGEGQNLQFCRNLVNFDLPWNPMLIEQRIGRLHRMGQTEEVRVVNLCAKGTVEERILAVLHQRLHLFELVVGEMDMVLGNLADERDFEERVLDLYREAASDTALDRGFESLATELATARKRYERTRELDAALFGRDYEA